MADTFQVAVPQTALDRSLELIEAWRDAPDDADIEVRVGRSDDGLMAAVCFTINGAHYGITVREARLIAEITANTIQKFPEQARKEGLPALTEPQHGNG